MSVFESARRATAILAAAAFLVVGLIGGCARPLPTEPAADAQVFVPLRASLLADGGGASSAAAASTGTGWATLKGSFKLAAGAPLPTPKALKVDKETGICAPGGKQVMGDTLLVDSASRGIANVAVYVRVTQRVHDSAKPSATPVLFDQEKCLFKTRLLPIVVGQEVEIKNSDPIGHNTNVVAQKGKSVNVTIPANSSVKFTPDKEETFPISATCSIHTWMQSYWLPRANGYLAVSKPDGSFEIPNLPDGEDLEFQVWHESAAGPSGALVGVEVAGAGVKWSDKGRFKLKLSDQQVATLDVTVPATSFKQ